MVLVMLLAGACSQLDVHKGLVLLDPLSHDVLDRDIRIAFEDPPCGHGVDVIEKKDRRDFLHDLAVKIPERRTQLVRVGILAVHNDDRLFAGIDEIVDVVLHKGAGIRNLAVLGKGIAMPLVKQVRKLPVAVQDVALVCRRPVDIHLVGIIGQIRVVKAGRSFGPALSQAVRHEEQLLEIRPVDPDGKQALAVIDAVGDQPVDLYHMMAEFRAEFCDEVDAVIRKLLEAGGRDELRHGEQPTALHAHCVVDPFIIALNSGSDDTEIADDPGIFIPLQLIVQLQLRRLMLIFKNAQRNADQIGNF